MIFINFKRTKTLLVNFGIFIIFLFRSSLFLRCAEVTHYSVLAPFCPDSGQQHGKIIYVLCDAFEEKYLHWGEMNLDKVRAFVFFWMSFFMQSKVVWDAKRRSSLCCCLLCVIQIAYREEEKLHGREEVRMR